MKKFIILFVVVLVGFIEAQWLPVNIRNSGIAANSNAFLYGDNSMAVFFTGSNYLFKSFDNGKIWMVDWFQPNDTPKRFSGTNGGHLMFVPEDLRSYFHSSNRGGGWRKVMTGIATLQTPSDIEGGRNNLFFLIHSTGIYRKSPQSDGLFKLTLPPTITESCNNLATFKISGEVFLTTPTGKMIKSTDDGTSWSELANFNTEILLLETYADTYVVFVGKRNLQRTIYFSANKGTTWDSIPTPLNFVELRMNTPARGFAKTDMKELYYTTDSMKTWTIHSSLKILKGCTTSGENGVLITPTYDVYTTTNSGKSWGPISDLQTNLVKDIEILPGSAAYALTASSELHFSGNYGNTWHLVKDSLPSPLTKLTKDTDTSFLAYSPGGPVIRYSNSSGKFTDLTQLCPNFTSPIYNYSGKLYVAKDSQNVSFSSDFGLTWTTKSIPPTAAVNFLFAVDSMIYIASNAGTYYESTDLGNSWVARQLSSVPGDKILFIYRNAERLWACTKLNYMYLSTTYGVSWIQVRYKHISKAFYFNKYFWVMQSYLNDIVLSVNEGRTWNEMLFFPPASNIASLKFNTTNFGLMLDVNGSLFVSFNRGLPVELTSFNAEVVPKGVLLRWETATETNNYGFFVQRKNNGVWSDIAMIPGMGTTLNPSSYSFLDELRPDKGDTNYYRLKQVDLSGEFSFSKEEAIGFTPYTLELDQNYPNPFSTASENGNNETIIRFRLPEDGETKLTVYDTQGRVVEELHNGSLPAGEHSFAFPSKVNLPASGVYFYELRFNGKIKRGKMLLLR
ncbi:MAG: T9SS type A sorting domain-containing protein [Ignavibacteriales bacterium]|nr:T9SS type A sorting domain-containing protein [Ignavibacteriales bacterium]